MKKGKKIYNRLFKNEKVFRDQWEGKIALRYKVPKEVNCVIGFIKNLYPNTRKISILEIGAGDGYSSRIIKESLKPKRYVATELSKEGVKKIKENGITAKQMDATDLKYKDNSFDIVISFNTMHHVHKPARMAQEMMRVSKLCFALCEANALSIPRRLLEHTKRNKKAGEKSYTPKKYRLFFEGCKWIELTPFMFAFAFTPKFLFIPAIVLSEMLEKVPFFRWQGSSLFIRGCK